MCPAFRIDFNIFGVYFHLNTKRKRITIIKYMSIRVHLFSIIRTSLPFICLIRSPERWRLLCRTTINLHRSLNLTSVFLFILEYSSTTTFNVSTKKCEFFNENFRNCSKYLNSSPTLSFHFLKVGAV